MWITARRPALPASAGDRKGQWFLGSASPKLPRRAGCKCETCSYFQTSIEFRPALAAQRDDAAAKHQDHREQLFTSLLARLDQDAS